MKDSEINHNKMNSVTKINVVNVRKQELVKKGYTDFEEWIVGKDNVYIGRNMSHYITGATGSIWGNPFVVANPNKNHKSNMRTYTPVKLGYSLVKPGYTPVKLGYSLVKPGYTLDESLAKYRQYIESTPELTKRLHELKGKTLGCWCKPNRCHGDILVELVEKYCN